jgi:hypothetical protein
MKTVGIDNDISIADEVRFLLETTDGSGCLKTPYKVVNATIYFISREFTDSNATRYDLRSRNQEVFDEYEKIKQAVCTRAKQSVKAASTSELALSGTKRVDGIDLEVGDRVLVKNQSDKSKNGIYMVSDGSWVRSDDANSSQKVVEGMYLFVESGMENIDTGWVLEPGKISLGTTPLNFLLFSRAGSALSPDDKGEENLSRLTDLKSRLDASTSSAPFYFKDALPVAIFGGETGKDGEVFPAWLNPSMVPEAVREKTAIDNRLSGYEEGGELVPGKFILEWIPEGMREGDYFICWTWSPDLGGTVLSSHVFFSLAGSSLLNTSIPTHRTRAEKYETLLERYLPDMFKNLISDSDLTPQVLGEFNKAVAKGFTFMEDQANQIIDLLDANATNEQFLPLLSNFFNLRLKSYDPVLWRRQIKKAVPNFKKKGSIDGLKSALGDAGMKFLKLTRTWQVVSKYTHQEHFTFSGSNDFQLAMEPKTPFDCNFQLWRRNKGENRWMRLGHDCSSPSFVEGWSASYVEIEGRSVTWVGPELRTGDSIRILYRFRDVPISERQLENYIRENLALMDNRDERLQDYPLKNWNVRLIEEDDPLFDRIVPTRNPFADSVVWGKIRTEFPYSENAYNMDEYNGSKRDSTNPCDVDRDFLDRCGQCSGSKFNLDLEVEMLSDGRMKEVADVLEEYLPFHASANFLNLSGSTDEFVRVSDGDLQILVTGSSEEVLVAGEAQRIFNRSVYQAETERVRRDVLADFESAGTFSGVLKNKRLCLFPSFVNSDPNLATGQLAGTTQGFDSISVNTSNYDEDPLRSGNLLEVLVGSSTRHYTLKEFSSSSAEVGGSVDPSLIGVLFEYRISNKVADLVLNVTQADQTTFQDDDADFWMLGLITSHDRQSDPSLGEEWHLCFNGVDYAIADIRPDGSLILGVGSSCSHHEGWRLYSGSVFSDDSLVKMGVGGEIKVRKRGLAYGGSSVKEILKIGDFVYMEDKIYRIMAFRSGDEGFYLEDYDRGGVGGEAAKVYRRVMERKVGGFAYDGLVLSGADTGLFSTSDTRNIKENFLVYIGSEYYSISGVEGSDLNLDGPMDSYTKQGRGVQFVLYKFTKNGLELTERAVPPYTDAPPKYDFDSVDRSGGVILTNSQADPGLGLLSRMLNSGDPIDFVTQGETIDFKIEYRG